MMEHQPLVLLLLGGTTVSRDSRLENVPLARMGNNPSARELLLLPPKSLYDGVVVFKKHIKCFQHIMGLRRFRGRVELGMALSANPSCTIRPH